MFQFGAFQTGQVSVTSAATQIVAANSSRSGISIVNLGTTDVYIGENANVTTSTGHLLTGTKGASVNFACTGAIYGITGGSSQSVSYLQTN